MSSLFDLKAVGSLIYISRWVETNIFLLLADKSTLLLLDYFL